MTSSQADGPPSFEPSDRRKIAMSWWLASELVRRHPELALIETHPSDGQYDCLTLVQRTGWQTVLELNRAGSALATRADGTSEKWPAVWREHAGHSDAHMAVRRLEDLAGLARPVQTPPTGPAALVYRAIARLLAMQIDDRSAWDCRNEILDSSGGDGGHRGYVTRFTAATEQARQRRQNDVLDTPGYRFWALLRDKNPVAVFETTGLAFVGDQRLDLMDMYRRDRRLFPVIAAVVGDILP